MENNILKNTIDDELKKKYNLLKEYFKDKTVIISYSGGADSLLVAKIASNAAKEHLAITIDNGFFTKQAIINSKIRAKKYNINHKIINIDYFNSEFNNKNNNIDINIENINNDLKNRCYYCKKDIALTIKGQLKKYDYDMIVDGTNYSDLFEDRPGIKAYKEQNIKSPLAELHITKKEVFKLLDYLDMELPKKDSCLATRILTPPITTDKLKTVEMAENYLVNLLNIKEYFRVRTYYDIAIVEITEKDYCKLNDIKNIKQINNEFKKLGFTKCCFELIEK
ncbi:ATP-dependent sacrificial sulfur transferase LarE [Methanococcus aeolicus]|uniref:ExsB family protein n=1 Tax=Methanococcus aeolicus (strain ATCC BAA-1280 / DSM 17508 / OCM 812 / Nankai-3) TaxID=419665 RepID=A6UTF4_META3|nr:ATP-dependent sacrificial sulfur transferase LarE [Methanococcus aeolicus]ABR55776.1 ExsB family protein [Methanococcus aeolicus Nankai-3]UXM84118.1 ATP-dependent sacrificial sulfur transferase LarE [Methanococcus aeolicus]